MYTIAQNKLFKNNVTTYQAFMPSPDLRALSLGKFYL